MRPPITCLCDYVAMWQTHVSMRSQFLIRFCSSDLGLIRRFENPEALLGKPMSNKQNLIHWLSKRSNAPCLWRVALGHHWLTQALLASTHARPASLGSARGLAFKWRPQVERTNKRERPTQADCTEFSDKCLTRTAENGETPKLCTYIRSRNHQQIKRFTFEKTSCLHFNEFWGSWK